MEYTDNAEMLILILYITKSNQLVGSLAFSYLHLGFVSMNQALSLHEKKTLTNPDYVRK